MTHLSPYLKGIALSAIVEGFPDATAAILAQSTPEDLQAFTDQLTQLLKITTQVTLIRRIEEHEKTRTLEGLD